MYKKVLENTVLLYPEMQGKDIRTILKAREEGLALLKENIARNTK